MDPQREVRNEVKDFSKSKFLRWKRKEQIYVQFIDSQLRSQQDMRLAIDSTKQEVAKMKNAYATESYKFGLLLNSYHSLLEENRKLYNEVQDLKGGQAKTRMKQVASSSKDVLGFGDPDSVCDISDGGTQTDGSINRIVEHTLFPEKVKPSAEITEIENVPAKVPRRPTKQGQAGSSRMSLSKSSSKLTSSKKPTAGSSSVPRFSSKRWQ